MWRSCRRHASGVTLGVQAVEHHRKKVRFFSTVDLVNTREQEKAQGKTSQIAEALVRADLVILDELELAPGCRTGSYSTLRNQGSHTSRQPRRRAPVRTRRHANQRRAGSWRDAVSDQGPAA